MNEKGTLKQIGSALEAVLGTRLTLVFVRLKRLIWPEFT